MSDHSTDDFAVRYLNGDSLDNRRANIIWVRTSEIQHDWVTDVDSPIAVSETGIKMGRLILGPPPTAA